MSYNTILFVSPPHTALLSFPCCLRMASFSFHFFSCLPCHHVQLLIFNCSHSIVHVPLPSCSIVLPDLPHLFITLSGPGLICTPSLPPVSGFLFSSCANTHARAHARTRSARTGVHDAKVSSVSYCLPSLQSTTTHTRMHLFTHAHTHAHAI